MTLGGMRKRKKGAFWWRHWIISAGLKQPPCVFWSHCCCLQTRVGVMGQPEYLRNPNEKRSDKNYATFKKPFSGAVANIFSFFFYFFPQIFFSAESRVFLIETLRSLDNGISSDGCCYCFVQSNKNPPFICLRTEWEAHAAKCFFFFCICTCCVMKMWEWNGALSQHRWDYSYCMLLFPGSRLQSFSCGFFLYLFFAKAFILDPLFTVRVWCEAYLFCYRTASQNSLPQMFSSQPKLCSDTDGQRDVSQTQQQLETGGQCGLISDHIFGHAHRLKSSKRQLQASRWC